MSERKQLRQGILALEAQRATLGDAVVDAMIAAAREKLALIDSPAVSKPSSTERKRTADFQGERKLVTVIIADVKSSTILLEHLGTEAWVALMNRVFHILETEIVRFGGAVDQFRGDGLVAFFGANVTHEDDPERAILAALAMQSQIKHIAEDVRARNDLELKLRIGINTGEVIIGNVGQDQHREDTAMGEAITVAARMEQAAEPGTVLVSENTFRLTQAQFRWQPLGTIAVKGISRPVAVYRPQAPAATTVKVRGISGLEVPMVGRQAELQALRKAMDGLLTGKGGIVTVVGEAGLGKSRLIADLKQVVMPAFAGLQWVEGRCPSYGTSIAYLLWLDVLRGLLGVTAETEPRVVREALRKRIDALATVKCRYPERRKTIYPHIGRLLSLPLDAKSTARIDEMEGEALKRGTFRAVESLIEGTAQQAPLVIVCEDLHWADPTSWELLERLFVMTDRVPLLFICVLRPETAYGGALVKKIAAPRNGHRHTNLWLVPLSPDESETLLTSLLKMQDLPQHLKTRILNHAEGNPFYLEEIIRALLDDGVIVRDDESGYCTLTCDTVDISIPNTLYGVLMSRIDRLTGDARRVLQLASVIGRTFPYRVLAAVNHEGYALDRILVTLAREELIVEQTKHPEPEYAFKHHLVQEVAYSSLLKQERATLHHRVAETLESLLPERRDAQIGVFALHWERAERSEKAIAYLLRAGEAAAMQFANVEAIDFFSRALTLAPGHSMDRFALLLARERVYDLTGARESQAQDLEALETLAHAIDDPQHEGQVALRRAHFAEVMGEYAVAIDASQKAIRLAKTTRDRAGEAAGYLGWGRACYYQGDYQGAFHRLQQALDRAADFPQVQADTLRSLGMVTTDQDEARSYLQQALHIHRKLGDQRGEWATYYNLSMLALERGDCIQATTYGERALRICRRIGDRQGERRAMDNLGYIALCQGDYARARSSFEQALAICHKTKDQRSEGHTLVQLCALFHLLDDHDNAARYGQNALDIARAANDPLTQGDALTFLGHTWHAQARLDDARAAYEQAVDVLTGAQAPQMVLDPLVGLAGIALERGNLAEARSLVTEIPPELDAMAFGYTEAFLRISLTCWRVLSANRDARARVVLADAHRSLRRRAARIQDPEMQRAFLEDIRLHREIVEAAES